MIVVPVRESSKIVGVLSVDQDRLNAFVERDLQMVQTLALQTGISLQNAHLFQQENNEQTQWLCSEDHSPNQ